MNLISTFYGEIYKDFKIDNFKQKWSNGQGGGGGMRAYARTNEQ